MVESHFVPSPAACIFGVLAILAVVIIVRLALKAQWLGAVAVAGVTIIAVAVLFPTATASVADSLTGVFSGKEVAVHPRG